MAYANKTTVTVPANTIHVDADRFWARHGAVSAQVRLDGADKVFLSYCDEHEREEMLTIDVPWESFCWELKAMIERLNEQ